jgi:GH35 family endo-1,4-beta-xylanase
MEQISDQLDAARDRFVEALQHTDAPEKAAKLADESLSLGVRASEEMCRFHARVFLARRQSSGGFARGAFVGSNVSSTPLKTPLKIKWTDAFDFVRVPFVWREIQPKESAANYETVDAVVKTCAKEGLTVRGGAVLNFGVQSVPDWAYIWENDYEAIVDFAREHVRRTLSRYAGTINQWTVATGLHADGVFSFTFEQIMDLTRQAMTTAKQAAPKAQTILDLSQPWGEYYARNQRTVPPMLYAEMAVQSGVPFDAFGLQFVYGVDSEGFHLRDTLQISSLIDRLANLGKPIHVTAMGVPSRGDAGGAWGAEWTEASQAEWFVNLAEIALSKPYVESVCVQSVTDDSRYAIPGCGVVREDGVPKTAYAKLVRLKAGLTKETKK